MQHLDEKFDTDEEIYDFMKKKAQKKKNYIIMLSPSINMDDYAVRCIEEIYEEHNKRRIKSKEEAIHIIADIMGIAYSYEKFYKFDFDFYLTYFSPDGEMKDYFFNDLFHK